MPGLVSYVWYHCRRRPSARNCTFDKLHEIPRNEKKYPELYNKNRKKMNIMYHRQPKPRNNKKVNQTSHHPQIIHLNGITFN